MKKPVGIYSLFAPLALTALTASLALPARAADPSSAVSEQGTASSLHSFDLPGDTQATWNKGMDMAHDGLSNALFSQASNFKVYQVSDQYLGVGLYLGRTVYNNLDVAQSFTVLDTITLPVTLFSYSVPVGPTALALQFGIGGTMQMKDFRVVSHSGLNRLESVQARAKGIEATELIKSLGASFRDVKDPDGTDPAYQEVPKEPKSALSRLDTMDQSRFSRIWNEATFPMRLPLKAEWIDRIEVGEVIAYGGQGYVEFGPGIGVVANLPEVLGQIPSVSVAAGVHVFVRGEYDIVILREDTDHVKVKVLRREAAGSRVFANVGTSTTYLFDGYVAFGKEVKVGAINFVPFNFEHENSRGSSIEQGFRFDLRNAEARAAYDFAVKGRFAEADEAASRGGQGVERVFRSDAKESGKSTSRSLKMMLYSQNRNTSTVSSDAQVQLKDQKHHVYSTVVDNHFDKKSVFRTGSRFETKATIDWSDSKLGMILEAWIDDQHTSGNDLREYSEDYERLLHKGEIFPRMPLTMPKRETVSSSESSDPSNSQPPPAQYGNSSFYLRMDVDQAQIQRFVETPETDKWRILEDVFGAAPGSWQDRHQRGALKAMNVLGSAFNVFLSPVDARVQDFESTLVAESIHRKWSELEGVKDPAQLTKKLGAIFADRVYGMKLMQVFTNAIDTGAVSYMLSASNRAFGRINLQQGSFGGTGKTLEEYRREANLENPQQVGHNLELNVGNLRASSPDYDHIVIDFSLTVVPHTLYLRFDSGGLLPQTKKELVVLNTGWLKVGDNHIVIDRNKNSFSRSILESLDVSGNYKLSVALGAADHSWGQLATVGFAYKSAAAKPSRASSAHASRGEEAL